MELQELVAKADEIYTKNERRKELKRLADALTREIDTAKTTLLAELKKRKLISVAGDIGAMAVGEKSGYSVNDWPTLHEHVRSTNSFHLLEKRLAKGPAAQDIKRDGSIPGVSVNTTETLDLAAAATPNTVVYEKAEAGSTFKEMGAVANIHGGLNHVEKECSDDLRKFYGMEPYNVSHNSVMFDGYFANSLKDKYDVETLKHCASMLGKMWS